MQPTTTLAYKTTPAGLSLEFDLFSPPTITSEAQPCIVFYHIGSLFYGDRKTCIPEWLIQGCHTRGWSFISADYRLLPEANVHEVMEDVKDLWSFLQTQLNDTLKDKELTTIDTSSIFLSGGSAGGYLTLQGGHLLKPAPTALVSMYGYTFTNDVMFAQPHPDDMQIMGSRLDETAQFEQKILGYFEKGKAQVGGRPFDPSQAESNFYSYLVWKGRYYKEVFGCSSSPEAKDRPELHYLFPQTALKAGDTYPPVLLIHGKEDTPIPYTESVQFAEWLKKRGHECELILLDGQEHIWDLEDNEIADGGRKKVWSFLDSHAPSA